MKRIERISLKQLRALRAVDGHGTITAAADFLGLTGPAVHNQMKLLEECVGWPLIHRPARGRATATLQGQALLAAYAEVEASLEKAIRRIDALGSGKAGSVVLGVVSTAKYFAPRIVAMLMGQMPGIEVVLKVANREATIAALARGEFDLCIMGRPPREPLADATPLVDHPHVIIAGSDHSLAHGGTVSQDEILAQRFVLREPGSGTRILATRFLDEIGRGREVETIEMDSNETIKQAVLNGLGIALLSAHTVADELQSGRLVALPIAGTPIIRKWYVLSLLDAPASPASIAVRKWLIANSSRYFPQLRLPDGGGGA